MLQIGNSATTCDIGRSVGIDGDCAHARRAHWLMQGEGARDRCPKTQIDAGAMRDLGRAYHRSLHTPAGSRSVLRTSRAGRAGRAGEGSVPALRPSLLSIQSELDRAIALLQRGDAGADRLHCPPHELGAFPDPGSSRTWFLDEIGLPRDSADHDAGNRNPWIRGRQGRRPEIGRLRYDGSGRPGDERFARFRKERTGQDFAIAVNRLG